MMGTMGDRKIVNDPWTDARTSTSLAGLFNPVSRISEQYEYGSVKQALGFSWMRDQTVIKHTAGTFTAGTVNGGGQSGSSLVTNAITGTLNQGDIITIANVIAVNRVTKQSTGMSRQFVVTANVLSVRHRSRSIRRSLLRALAAWTRSIRLSFRPRPMLRRSRSTLRRARSTASLWPMRLRRSRWSRPTSTCRPRA
jgi:hypothetical protein